MKRIIIIATLGTALAALAGCGAHDRTPNHMPPLVPPQQYTEPEDRYHNPGSLYSAHQATDLYADNRARRVGDIVLIKVVENSKSKSKADTTTGRTSTSSLGVTAAFGKNSIGPLVGGPSALTGSVGVDPMLSTSSGSDLKATGETKRENYVTATVGARVVQVLPGNILQVQGAREIRVNDETQFMVVSGLIRASDVASDNSVLSTQMADSKVDYYGKGILADKQRSGWLTRLLDNVWPF